MAIIQIKGLQFSYDRKHEAINNINLNIEKGKWVAVVGPNGSGKSTLAKLLVGLLEADKGTIFIDGLELNQKNIKEIRKKIGIVFQNPDNQFVGVTVRHDIAFGLEKDVYKRQLRTRGSGRAERRPGHPGYFPG